MRAGEGAGCPRGAAGASLHLRGAPPRPTFCGQRLLLASPEVLLSGPGTLTRRKACQPLAQPGQLALHTSSNLEFCSEPPRGPRTLPQPRPACLSRTGPALEMPKEWPLLARAASPQTWNLLCSPSRVFPPLPWGRAGPGTGQGDPESPFSLVSHASSAGTCLVHAGPTLGSRDTPRLDLRGQGAVRRQTQGRGPDRDGRGQGAERAGGGEDNRSSRAGKEGLSGLGVALRSTVMSWS